MDSSPKYYRTYYFYLLILLVGFLAQGFALRAGFYMDDNTQILDNHQIYTKGKDWVVEGKWYKANKRILPYFFYATIYRIAGPSSFAFHLLNLSLHLLISCLLFPIACTLFRLFRFPQQADIQFRERTAFFGALVFACHPLCTEAVCYTRCSMIQLVSLFSLLTVWWTACFLEKKQIRWALASILAILGATYSKDPGIFHALGNVLLILLAFFLTRKKAPLLSLKNVFFLLLAVSLGSLLFSLTNWDALLLKQLNQPNFHAHLFTQARIFWDYLSLVLLPINLCSDHLKHWSASLRDTETLVKFSLLLLFCSAILIGFWKKKTRFFSLLLSLAIAPLLLRFLYMGPEVMVEYRVYPGMPWFSILAGMLLAFLYFYCKKYAGIIIIIFILSRIGLSAQRAFTWRHSVALQNNVLHHYPDNNRARVQTQNLVFHAGYPEKAIQMYEQVADSLKNITDYNKKYEGKRFYDLKRAYINVFYSEKIVAYALAQTEGQEAALAFLEKAIARAKQVIPGFFVRRKKRDGTFYEKNVLLLAQEEISQGKYTKVTGESNASSTSSTTN